MYTVITLSGIGEASTQWTVDPMIDDPAAANGDWSKTGPIAGMCKYFTDELGDQFRAAQFNWQDKYGPAGGDVAGPAYDTNIHAAANDLAAFVLARPSNAKIILMGYSGGANVVALAAPMIEQALLTANGQANPELTAIVYVANPARHRNDSGQPWWGITGERVQLADEVVYHPALNAATSHTAAVELEAVKAQLGVATLVFDVANDKDVIPCCPEDQPLRDFFELSRYFSFMAFPQWGLKAIDWVTHALIYGNSAAQHATLGDWLIAIAYVRGYLFDGQHTTYYQNVLPGMAVLFRGALGAS